MKSKEEIKNIDKKFRQLYITFMETRDKKIWQEMFIMVRDACESVIKKKCTGLIVPDFYGKITETSLDVMKRLAKDVQKGIVNIPDKLVTLVYSYSLWALYSPATKFFEKQVSYEGYLEENGEKEVCCY